MMKKFEDLKLNYTVGGVLWLDCPACNGGPLVIYHSRFKDHIPFCNNCKKEFKLSLTEIERKEK